MFFAAGTSTSRITYWKTLVPSSLTMLSAARLNRGFLRSATFPVVIFSSLGFSGAFLLCELDGRTTGLIPSRPPPRSTCMASMRLPQIWRCGWLGLRVLQLERLEKLRLGHLVRVHLEKVRLFLLDGLAGQLLTHGDDLVGGLDLARGVQQLLGHDRGDELGGRVGLGHQLEEERVVGFAADEVLGILDVLDEPAVDLLAVGLGDDLLEQLDDPGRVSVFHLGQPLAEGAAGVTGLQL